MEAFTGQSRLRFNAAQSDRRQRARGVDHHHHHHHLFVRHELFAASVAPWRAGSFRCKQRQPFRSRVTSYLTLVFCFLGKMFIVLSLVNDVRSDQSLSGLDSPLPPPPIRCCCIQGCVRKKAVLKDGRRPAVSAWQRYWIQLSGSNLLFYQPKHLRG